MALFPTIWELLIPNFNITTIIGIVMILLGTLGIFLLFRKTTILIMLGLGGVTKGIGKFSVLFILIGIVLIFGVSIVEDFITSQGGATIFIGTLIVLVLGFVLFWKPKSKKSELTKLFS